MILQLPLTENCNGFLRVLNQIHAPQHGLKRAPPIGGRVRDPLGRTGGQTKIGNPFLGSDSLSNGTEGGPTWPTCGCSRCRHGGPPGTPWTHRAGAEQRAPITPASLVPRTAPLSYNDELPILVGLWLLFSRSVVSDSL